MALPTASDNPFPSLLITEGTEPSAPAAGKQRLYIDSTSHRLMATNSSGTERDIERAAPAFHGCRVYNSTTQNVSNTTDTQLTHDSEDFDTDAYHSTSSATDRITIPSGLDGKYLVRGHTTWNANATGDRIMVLRKNGADIAGTAVSIPVNSASIATRMMTSCIVSLVATDYLQINVYQTSGGTRTAGGSGGDATAFEASLLGA